MSTVGNELITLMAVIAYTVTAPAYQLFMDDRDIELMNKGFQATSNLLLQ